MKLLTLVALTGLVLFGLASALFGLEVVMTYIGIVVLAVMMVIVGFFALSFVLSALAALSDWLGSVSRGTNGPELKVLTVPFVGMEALAVSYMVDENREVLLSGFEYCFISWNTKDSKKIYHKRYCSVYDDRKVSDNYQRPDGAGWRGDTYSWDVREGDYKALYYRNMATVKEKRKVSEK